jgi:hypothetical protein
VLVACVSHPRIDTAGEPDSSQPAAARKVSVWSGALGLRPPTPTN